MTLDTHTHTHTYTNTHTVEYQSRMTAFNTYLHGAQIHFYSLFGGEKENPSDGYFHQVLFYYFMPQTNRLDAASLSVPQDPVNRQRPH